jgi:uncharacterized protein DUF4377
MSLRPSLALSVFLSALACSCAKPPESNTPEPGASEPTPASTTTATDPATPEAPAAKQETLFVRDQRAPCEAEAKRECLQVKNAESEPWRNLFATIEGFEYEPGYQYELKVEVSPLANPPADASSLRYTLLEVVSKKKTAQ